MHQKGFTLMELLITISIVALLSAAVLFTITNVQARARDAKRSADVDQLVKALDLYINQTGASYPIAPAGFCLTGTDAVNTALLGANLISTPISDPVNQTGAECLFYTTNEAGTEFAFRFYLETGSVGQKGMNTRP